MHHVEQPYDWHVNTSTHQQGEPQHTNANARSFASDNYSGAHPEVIEAIEQANIGHAPAYGADPWTEKLQSVVRAHFGSHAEAFPVFNGTGANVLSLQAALPRWGAVICAETAHIHNDEGGAPEKVGGLKLLPVPTPDAKLTPDLIDREARGWGDEHRAQPLVVSITQSTELGTCYTPAEIRAIADHAHARGMTLHLDGARISNAAAHLNCTLAAMTTEVGVDVVSLGGTKNGLLGAEAVIALNPEAVPGLKFLRKTNMQLGSKMRFISAQLIALYEHDLWLRSAQHANQLAQRLRSGIEHIIASGSAESEGMSLPTPTQANAVFVTLPPAAKQRAHERFHFYDWPGQDSLVRLMCSFDTTPAEVDELLAALADV